MCIRDRFIDVEILSGTPLVLLENKIQIRCIGDANGAIDLEVTGGFEPYSYEWSNGSTSEDIVGLIADTYTVTVTDDTGCESIKDIQLQDPDSIVSNAIVNEVQCFEANNGSIQLLPSGGTAPYTYAWDNGVTSNNRSGLIPLSLIHISEPTRPY